MVKTAPSARKPKKRIVPEGIAVAHIQATFNNTIVTISDKSGQTISWSSAGNCGFKGSRKGTPFAAQQAAEKAGNQARDCGARTLEICISGPGPGRDSAVRALYACKFKILTIRDLTPIPFNGCRPPKKRRI